MKKLYTILGSAFLLGSMNAQVYLGKDFEDQDIHTGGFTDQVIVGTSDWFAASYSGNNFAKMSNYNGTSNAVSETWYITPAIDLTSATSPIFSFASAANFNGDDIEVYTSIDFDGTSDPNTQGTWVQLSPALSTGNNYDWVNSGEIAVPNTSATTYFAFKYTGGATDGKTWEIDSVFVAEAGETFVSTIVVAPPSTVSVYDIQNSTGASPYEGQNVSTGGIVTHVRDDGNYYIKSGNGPFSGIYVFDASNTVAPGDSVTFSATVDEFYDLTELKNISNFVNVSSGNFFFSNPITTAQILTEEYEGVLVSVCGQATSEEGQYQDWTINDGSGNGNVDNYAADYHPGGTNITPPVIGNSYEVKGIVDYSYSEFKILPRSAADVAQTAQCVVSVNENEVVYNVYPNPTNNTLNIDVEGNHTATIVDINGRVLNTMVVNGFTSINVANLANGVYFINLDGNMTKFIKK